MTNVEKNSLLPASGSEPLIEVSHFSWFFHSFTWDWRDSWQRGRVMPDLDILTGEGQTSHIRLQSGHCCPIITMQCNGLSIIWNSQITKSLNCQDKRAVLRSEWLFVWFNTSYWYRPVHSGFTFMGMIHSFILYSTIDENFFRNATTKSGVVSIRSSRLSWAERKQFSGLWCVSSSSGDKRGNLPSFQANSFSQDWTGDTGWSVYLLLPLLSSHYNYTTTSTPSSLWPAGLTWI